MLCRYLTDYVEWQSTLRIGEGYELLTIDLTGLQQSFQCPLIALLPVSESFTAPSSYHLYRQITNYIGKLPTLLSRYSGDKGLFNESG